MNPDHLPRPFDPPHSGDEPVRVWVHGGDFDETDLIRALNETVLHFTNQGIGNLAIYRATQWLAQKYGRDDA